MRRCAAALLQVALAAPAPAQEVSLRGRVVTLDGRPATEARLQIVGQAAQLAIRSPSGTFAQPLAGRPAQVEIAPLAGPLEVLYPLDGIVPVPRDDSVHVTIVVGKPERASISEMLAQRLVRLETVLEAQGVQYDAARDSLSQTLERILEQLELDRADLRRDVVFQREQAATAPQILRTVDAYLRELKDLRDGFRQFAPLAVRDRAAKQALQRTMQEYSDAFTDLNDNRRAFESQLLNYWPAPQSGVLVDALSDVYLEAVENVHQALVLPLNPDLIVLQRAGGSDRDERERAARDVVDAAGRIDGRLPALEQRARELRDALERE